MTDWSNRRCLVTGGAGFIGCNLALKLATEGAGVVVLDDLSTGQEANLVGLEAAGVGFVRGSILDRKVLAEVLEGVDYLFHQAARPSVPESIQEPLATNRVNGEGVLLVLEAARNAGVKKVVFASSCAVYGDNPCIPLAETELPVPLSPYAVQKLTGEYYCRVYHQAYNLPTTALRYFNVYGPRQDPNSQYAAAIPNFINASLDGKPIRIYGDGEQSRDFIFVEDVVRANMAAATTTRADGQVVNIATGQQVTINKLARQIVELTGAQSELAHAEERPGDIRHSLADIARAEELMDFAPEYGLERGLAETVAYFGGLPRN